VELAAQIIMELPNDSEVGVPQAKEAARGWLENMATRSASSP
jgi:hypothetical protein